MYKHTVYLIDGDAIVGRTRGKRLRTKRIGGEAFFVVSDFGLTHTIPVASVLFVESESVEE